MKTTLTFTVNGRLRTVSTEPDRPLLDVLREDLELLGTNQGCGEGQCGACTVLLNGKSLVSCITPVSNVAGQTILTIEGLATEDRLHPVQEAFLAESAFQCGYCTPGMILGTVAFLKERPDPTEEDIRIGMQGHICRCCGYVKISKAIHRAAAAMKG